MGSYQRKHFVESMEFFFCGKGKNEKTISIIRTCYEVLGTPRVRAVLGLGLGSLRLSEYRRESLEMKLKKRRLDISICLCIMSLPLNYQNFLNPFLVSFFLKSEK